MNGLAFTRHDLAEIGELIYGDGRGWKAQLAERLGKCKRLIEYYASGDRAIPADMRRDLDDLIEAQVSALWKFHSVHGETVSETKKARR